MRVCKLRRRTREGEAMTTLRDRLIALADANDDAMQGTDWAAHKMRYVVFAAARMALEDAEKAMDSGDVVDWVEAGLAIRALRDKLEP